MPKPPSECKNMTELRAAIDVLDADIVASLAKRVEYIKRATEIKQGAGLPARINDRVNEVVAKARANATNNGIDPELTASIWNLLIEWSISLEETTLGK